MTFSLFVHFSFAFAFGLMAWLTWWKGMPTVIVHRGKLSSYVTWLLGMAMAFYVTVHLNSATNDAPVEWVGVAGDTCLLVYAAASLVRIRSLGSYHWGKDPAADISGEVL